MVPPAISYDLACFGYLAYAQVVRVRAYPQANTGATVAEVIPSLAGDAPITALTATRLGHRTCLVANRVSLDPPGQAVLDTLDAAGVVHRSMPAAPGGGTPQLTIVTDEAGTRTWFAWLGAAVDQLISVDLTPLRAARLAYVDCYRIIEHAAAAAIAATEVPLLLNLGGDPLSATIAAAVVDRHVAFVQTNAEEPDLDRAEALVADLYSRMGARAAVVTLGRHGALACAATGTYRTAAPTVAIRHTHGAGAAFSGGLAHAYLTGANITEALQAGCAAGTAHCAAVPSIPRPRTPTVVSKESHP